MTQTSVYGGGAPYTDAWIPSNATANNNDVTSGNGPINQQDVFEGGYAGNCPTGQAWTYVDGESWACTGALQWSFDYYVPNVDSQSYTGKTGIFLNKSIFFDDATAIAADDWPPQSFTGNWELENGNIATLEEIRYVCYPGKPQNIDFQSTTMTVNSGSIPDSTSNARTGSVFLPYEIDLSGNDQYSCNFEFLVDEPGGTSWEDDLGGSAELSDDLAPDRLNINDYISSLGTLQGPNQAESDLLSIPN